MGLFSHRQVLFHRDKSRSTGHKHLPGISSKIGQIFKITAVRLAEVCRTPRLPMLTEGPWVFPFGWVGRKEKKIASYR